MSIEAPKTIPQPRPEILRKRAEFLRAARAGRAHTDAFTLQALNRGEAVGPGPIRVGFTCSKKVGNAVARNRAKRRLRAVAAGVLPEHGRPGWDYVLIGRKEVTANHPFHELIADLKRALAKVHRGRSERR